MNANHEYDAIWLGGGASGRFGAAFHKVLEEVGKKMRLRDKSLAPLGQV